jgi:YHS domain-containing protein
MSKSLLAVACAILLGVGILTSASKLHGADAPTTQPAVDTKPINAKCPVSGEDLDPNVSIVYEGKTIGFCCQDCVKAFKKNPEKYADKIK